MSDTIKRWECPECGRLDVTPAPWDHPLPGGLMMNDCPGVPVERVYVAQDADGLAEYKLGRHEGRQEFIDALLSDEAISAARDSQYASRGIYPDAFGERQALGPDEWRFARASIRAAIAQAIKEQQ